MDAVTICPICGADESKGIHDFEKHVGWQYTRHPDGSFSISHIEWHGVVEMPDPILTPLEFWRSPDGKLHARVVKKP